MSTADTILLRCTGRATQEQWKEIQGLAAEAGAKDARGYGNTEETYVYFDFAAPKEVKADAIGALESKVSAKLGGAKVSGVALKKVSERKGVSVGFPAPIHYVVEMDFPPVAAAELTKWYEEEHLAGLGSVEGCVRTSRFMSEAGRSFACYDLNSNIVPEKPEWQKWRDTEWTRRVRQHHQNMKRGIYAAL